MRTCEDFATDLTGYVDGKLPLGPRVSMWLHSAVCKSCRAYRHQIVLVRNVAPDCFKDDAPSDAKLDELGNLFSQEHAD